MDIKQLVKKNGLALVTTLMVFTGSCYAQKTISFDPEKGSPKASLSEVSWIAGHWRGEGMGGIIEEIWSTPFAGSMMGSFKFVESGTTKFYELELITEENETLILRLKHFHANLKGWEEKDETVDFKLAKLTNTHAYFDGFTFEKLGVDEMNIYVVIGNEDKRNEMKFHYQRVAN